MDAISTPQPCPILLILSGPAGVGKTTLEDGLLARYAPRLQRVITATTRPRREGEVDGKHYRFFSREGFEKRIAEGAFYEWAEVHGNLYGSLKVAIHGPMSEGRDLILNIDVQGAASYRAVEERDPQLRGRMVSVFVLPESMGQIEERLRLRGKDDDAGIERRLQTARNEIDQWRHYRYCYTSQSRADDLQRLTAIYEAEKCRVRAHSE